MDERTCSVDGCGTVRFARGFCNMHYLRVKRTGVAGDAAPARIRGRICSIDECDRKSDTNGMCKMHYLRVRKGGAPGPVETLRYGGPCTVGDCGRPAIALKLCKAHYEQQSRGVDFRPVRVRKIADPTARDAEGRKQCRTCLDWFPEDMFTVFSRSRDGRGPFCPRCRKDMALRAAHNITIDQYEAVLEAQGGVCAICREECSSGRFLAVDHDHSCCPGQEKSCGKCVRGLLCGNCNQGVGKFFDNPLRLRAAAAYLERRHG